MSGRLEGLRKRLARASWLLEETTSGREVEAVEQRICGIALDLVPAHDRPVVSVELAALREPWPARVEEDVLARRFGRWFESVVDFVPPHERPEFFDRCQALLPWSETRSEEEGA